ncbi:unnamed protein product [Colias eurytheme]|nr:unnamed protein product [Colias eurytheme]
MVQCKKCKLFLSATKDDVVKCKGTCGGLFHKKCAKKLPHNDLCEDCVKIDSTPKSPKIAIDSGNLTIENLLTEVNKKLETVFKIENKLQELTGLVEFYSECYGELLEFKHKADRRITALERRNVYLEKCNMALEERLEKIEQKELERNVELAFVECHENEDLKVVVESIAKKLNLPVEDIQEVKRVGAPEKKVVTKLDDKPRRPRPILLTLRSKAARDRWIKKRKILLTNHNIYGLSIMTSIFECNVQSKEYFNLTFPTGSQKGFIIKSSLAFLANNTGIKGDYTFSGKEEYL